MTTREEWLALAERAEKATGPDRELDAAITAATRYLPRDRSADSMINPIWEADGARVVVRAGPKQFRVLIYAPPAHTASLDAITALVEREFPGASWFGGHGRTRPDEPLGGARIFADLGGERCVGESEAATAPLAFCAAFCRAMAETQKARPT